MDSEDELICLGHDEDHLARQGAMTPPIVQTSLFTRPRFEDLLAGLAAEHENAVYTRGINPTVAVLERKLAALELGEAAKCFGSGMGAISAVLLGLLEKGDHVLFVNHVYGPTLQLADHLKRFGVTHNHLLASDLQSVTAALQPNTRLLYLESPGSMLFQQVDIAALTELARAHGLLTAIDNTWATPLYQKPLTMGVDLVIHSCSKYIGGHSDVIGGAVIGSAELLRQLFYRAFLLNGAAPAPLDTWLLLRGLRTLPARLRQHHQDALAVARFLAEHEGVSRVYHPGLNPDQRLLTQRQLSGCSGLFSFALRHDSFEAVAGFINKLRRFRIGVSWGGVESLVISPNRGSNRDDLLRGQIPPGLIRLSVGLEGASLLIDDLAQAFQTL